MLDCTVYSAWGGGNEVAELELVRSKIPEVPGSVLGAGALVTLPKLGSCG